MLLKKGSVKGIGELRHPGLARVHSWPASGLHWDLVINFFLRRAKTCNFLRSRGLPGISAAVFLRQRQLRPFSLFGGRLERCFGTPGKLLKTKQ